MTVAAAAPATVTFAFEDLERRTFVAVNRAGDGYHFVAPAVPWDPRVIGRRLDDGSLAAPLVRAGDLVCTCRGGQYRGTCYVVEAALARLDVDFGAVPGWDGAGASVEATRG